MTRIFKSLLFGSAILAAGDIIAGEDDSRASSAELSAAISAGLPKFAPKEGETTKAPEKGSPVLSRTVTSDPTISVLPPMTVTESKLPADDQFLTYEGKASKVMAAYMGDSDGLDRGFLNRFTLRQLWKKIPILGRLPFVGTPGSMTNEQRAFDRAGANDRLGRPVPSPNEPHD